MLSPDLFRYMPDSGTWRHDLPDMTELYVGGDEHAPDPAHIMRAAFVLEHRDELVDEARKYLRYFAAYERLQSQGQWHLNWIEVGCGGNAPYGEFELFLELDKDDYGLWSVRFKESSLTKQFHPFSLTRRQW